jgi:hypothetical protein
MKENLFTDGDDRSKENVKFFLFLSTYPAYDIDKEDEILEADDLSLETSSASPSGCHDQTSPCLLFSHFDFDKIIGQGSRSFDMLLSLTIKKYY